MKRFEASMYTPNITEYTYPGVLSTELFQKPKIDTPAMTEFATMRTGVRSGDWLNLVQPLTSILTKASTTCTPTYTQSGSITARKIQTAPLEINLSWCKKEFIATPTVLSDSDLIGDGLSGYELGGRLRTVILDEVTEALRIDLWKLLLFGNDTGLGSSFYSAFDGVWAKLFSEFNNYCVKPVSNAFPKANNSILNANAAVTALRLAWGDSPLLLKQMPANQKKFYVTGSVWENYLDSLIANCCVEGSWKMGQDGATQLYYRGIEVVPLWVADYALTDTANPFYNQLRHFIIYTTPANHVIATENAADLNNLKLCYDCRTKTTYIQGDMRLGYNFIQCDLQSVAF